VTQATSSLRLKKGKVEEEEEGKREAIETSWLGEKQIQWRSF
jgi:hypothetical protein